MKQFDTPKISIVTCSYQQGRTLDATIRSVLDQNYPALEYIVIDGASRDQSLDVIRRHGAALSEWVSEPDQGQTHALIKGFARSSGTLQGWLCSDDLLVPGALRQVADFFVRHPDIDAVYGDALWIDAQGRYLRPKKEMKFSRFALLFDHNYIAQPSMFWRASLYQKVGGLDTRFDLAMDSDLWERFSRHTRIAHVAAWWSCMRDYPEQKTRSQRAKSLAEARAIARRSALGSLADVPPFRAALRAVARLVRVGAKFAAGGYGAHAPQEILSALERYRIVEADRECRKS